MTTDLIYAEGVESLNLNDIDSGYQQLPLMGDEENKLTNPMIFQHDGRIHFFGGKAQPVKHHRTQAPIIADSELKEIIIEWEGGVPKSVKIVRTLNRNGQPILFPGRPVFMQTIPNSRYIAEKDTWLFVDDEGNYYTYHVREQVARHKNIMFNIK